MSLDLSLMVFTVVAEKNIFLNKYPKVDC